MPKRKTALENTADALSAQEPKKKKSAEKTSAASKTPAATHKHVAPKTTKSMAVTGKISSSVEDLGGQVAPPPPAREQIALRAYFHFLARGGQHGFDVEDWCRAERELLELA